MLAMFRSAHQPKASSILPAKAFTQVQIHCHERYQVLGIKCLAEDFAGPDTIPPFWSVQGNSPHRAPPQCQPLGMLAHTESVVWATPAVPET